MDTPSKTMKWGWDIEVSEDQQGWHITSANLYSQEPEDTTDHPVWSENLRDGVYNLPGQ